VRQLLGESIQRTRRLSFELSPPILYELGLPAAVEWLADRVQEQHGIEVTVRDDSQAKPLDEATGVVLFTAVRELLVNIVKHAQAERAEISIRREGDRIGIDVEDNGVGFEVSASGTSSSGDRGFGLFSIRERLSHLGGECLVHCEPGSGTQVTLVAPLRGHAEGRGANAVLA
jgi:signal transduction histidine kinase